MPLASDGPECFGAPADRALDAQKGEGAMSIITEVRSQKSRGSSSGGFGGPDRYTVVLRVPAGALVPRALQAPVLARRGITVLYRGEYYSRHGWIRGMARRVTDEARHVAENSV